MSEPHLTTDAAIFSTDPSYPPDTLVPMNLSGTLGYLVVQVFNRYADQAVWDVAHWDVDYWAGAGQWLDFSSLVRGLSWHRGSDGPLDRPRVGTATVTLANVDGTLSPWLETGPYPKRADGVAGPSWIEAGMLVRFGAFFGAGHTWYPFFTGRVEQLVEETSENVDGWLTLTVAEMTTDLGGWNGAEQAPTGAGDTLSQRVSRLLSDAGWDGGYSIDSDSIGDVATFQATTMAQNRLTELYLVGDSVGMRVLSDPRGKLVVTKPYPDASVAPTAVFSNDPAGGTYTPAVSMKPYSSLDRVVNTAVAARAGGVEITVVDNDSRNLRGIQNPNGSRDDLVCASDATVTAVLARQVFAGKDDVLGIESIELDADMGAELPFLMAQYASSGLEARTPIGVRFVHPSGNVLSTALVIEGFEFSIVPFGDGVPPKFTGTISTAKRVFFDTAHWDVDFWDIGIWG